MGAPEFVGGKHGVEGYGAVGVFEIGAVVGVEIGFAGGVFGEEEVVLGEFEVPVGDGLAGDLGDGLAVDEEVGGDEVAI